MHVYLHLAMSFFPLNFNGLVCECVTNKTDFFSLLFHRMPISMHTRTYLQQTFEYSNIAQLNASEYVHKWNAFYATHEFMCWTLKQW